MISIFKLSLDVAKLVALFSLTLFAAAPQSASNFAAQTYHDENGDDQFECMARDGDPGAIIVPASDVDAMLAKHFARVACGQFFADDEAKRHWRDRMCRFAATAPDGMQAQMEGIMGERPATLCGMAESVLGEWDQSQLYR